MIDRSSIEKLPWLQSVGTGNINAVTEQVHAAVQYPAMAGKYFGVHQDDDSHTNMAWNTADKEFNGRWHKVGNLRLSVAPVDLVLKMENGKELKAIELHGMSRKESIDWTRNHLSDFGFEGSQFKLSFHYDLPDYAQMKNHRFQKQNLDFHQRFGNIRTWGAVFCNHYRKYFSMAHESRTWPHHFDHGCYMPVAMHGDKVTKSVSIGLAIHDSLCPEHYFYTTYWSQEDQHNMEVPPLSNGRWEIDKLSGSLLPVSSLAGSRFEEQVEIVSDYFEKSINGCLQLMDISPQDFSI